MQRDDDMPCLVFTPASGGPGTLVRFSGVVDRDDVKVWKQYFGSEMHGMYRDFPDGGPTGDACELIVGLSGFNASLDATTRKVSGSFTIGSSGNCRQEMRSYPAYPGTYNLTAGCVSCVFAEYRVTPATLPATGTDTAGLVALGLGLCLTGAGAVALRPRAGQQGSTVPSVQPSPSTSDCPWSAYGCDACVVQESGLVRNCLGSWPVVVVAELTHAPSEGAGPPAIGAAIGPKRDHFGPAES